MTTPSFSDALVIRGLRKAYGSVVAVDGLDLTIHAGECFGLLGPNGAGKTTTVEICEGLIAPDAGEVVVLGEQWARAPKSLRARIGISLQETRLSDKLTVRETLQLFRSFYRDGHPVAQVLDEVDLTEKQDARVATLSGGQRQRLALACALVGNPALFFLDEPTTGLDPQSRRQIWELITRFRASGRTILLTTHYMDEAERLCDRVAIIDHGKVIALGTPRDLIARLGAGHVIEFSLEESENLDHLLGDIPGLSGIRRSERGWRMQAGSLDQTLSDILTRCREQRLDPQRLRVHSATLEDLFVTLTGRHLGDA